MNGLWKGVSLPTAIEPNPRSIPVRWNPLTDDGDALRAAVKRRLVVAVMNATHERPAFTAVYHFNGPEHVSEEHGNDEGAATRRAIVRVLSEIGRSMP